MLLRRPRCYSRRVTKLTIALALLVLVGYVCIFRLYWLRDSLYVIRPVFDTKTEFTSLPHYYHPAVANTSQLCRIHGWSLRDTRTPKVIDAVIFSLEFDLLEIRIRELWNVVDLFVVMEADRTFSGERKPLWLSNSLVERFSFAQSKLRVHKCRSLRILEPGESPFANEGSMRSCMATALSGYAQRGDVIIMADVDEIPRASTVHLFKHCTGYPSPIHLQLKTYFYSFEFFFSTDDSWRAKIVIYDHPFYNHLKLAKYILVDAGWHCTFCFRNLSDFRFKMTSYSHNDRLMGREYLLQDKELQRRICTGLDVFDMYPEVYSFKELVAKFGPIESSDTFVDIPRAVIENPQRFAFLLKGNCIREDYRGGPLAS